MSVTSKVIQLIQIFR